MRCGALLLAALLAMAVSAGAQTLNVVVGKVTYQFPSSETGVMKFTGGKMLTVMGKTFDLSQVTRMYVDYSEVTDNSVAVSYAADSAAVVVAGNVAEYVAPTVSGAHVTVAQSDSAADETCGEITYSLSGASTDGEFALSGSYKASVELNGLTLTNPSGAPLNLQDGKRIALTVKKDSENTLTDSESGSQKGCIDCKGHLELKGKGVLNIYGKTAHAIHSKEYVEMKNCTVNILSAVGDGINCNQYFRQESGALNVKGVGDDGIQVSYKDDTDREADDTGELTIAGGTLSVAVSANAAKGLKSDGAMTLQDGEVTITATGGGKWDSDESKAKASSCLSSNSKILISGGTQTLTASGCGGKGISSDDSLVVSGGTLTINTSGGLYAYVNGTEYTNYTGSTDRLSSDQKCSPKGIRVEGVVEIDGGNINVTTTGNGAEGIESKSTLTINDGTVVVSAYDDAINSSSHMYINGGDITVVASDNDGLDSNGNMYINGGVIKAFGTTSPECGIDANEEQNYTVIFTGGTLLAVGGGNSVPSTSESTQPYVSTTMSVSAGTEISVSSGSTQLATFTVPSNYSSGSSSQGGNQGGMGGMGGMGGHGGGSWGGSSSSVLISCAGMTSGSSYTITSGSSSSSATARTSGSGGNSGGGGGRF